MSEGIPLTHFLSTLKNCQSRNLKQKMITWDWFIEIPDCFKTKDLCEKVVQEVIDMFEYVPNELKMQEMCERAVERRT